MTERLFLGGMLPSINTFGRAGIPDVKRGLASVFVITAKEMIPKQFWRTNSSPAETEIEALPANLPKKGASMAHVGVTLLGRMGGR